MIALAVAGSSGHHFAISGALGAASFRIGLPRLLCMNIESMAGKRLTVLLVEA